MFWLQQTANFRRGKKAYHSLLAQTQAKLPSAEGTVTATAQKPKMK